MPELAILNGFPGWHPGYEDLSNLPKISGSPLLSNIAISAPPVAPPGFLDLFKKFFQPRLTVGNATLNVEIADTNLKRSRGLSGRKSLATDAGMLFVFSTKAKSRFWMQGMLFDLDFIWIRNKRVIQLDRYIVHPQPDQNPAIIVPQENVDQVLEVPAGFIDKYGIKIGDKVERGVVNISNLKVGTVSHYYDKIGVAVVEVTSVLHVGDHIKIAGSGEFTQAVDSIQVEHEKKESAKKVIRWA